MGLALLALLLRPLGFGDTRSAALRGRPIGGLPADGGGGVGDPAAGRNSPRRS